MSLWYLGASHGWPRPAPSVPHTLTQNTKPKDDALVALAKYVPAETTTLFLAAHSLAGTDRDAAWLFYAGCLVITPLFVLLVARREWQKTKVPPFVPPVWRMVAAAIAFAVWGLAVPGFLGNPVLAGVAALIVSPLLVLVEGAFGFDR